MTWDEFVTEITTRLRQAGVSGAYIKVDSIEIADPGETQFWVETNYTEDGQPIITITDGMYRGCDH